MVLLAAPAAAQEADCSTLITQADLNACAVDSWQAADADLNGAYQAAVARARVFDRDACKTGATPDAEATLRDAQRAWVAYRDPACLAQSRYIELGSAYPMVYYGCLEGLTRDRTDMLRDYAGE
nr:lysozyme inhibitor LprI family protein [Rubellimicrobium arenae]